jgi:hypothetical protein
MARTPDRTPGPSIEEELQLEDLSSDPSVVGAITQNAGALKGRDSIGIFNLRSGAGISEGSHRILDQLVHSIAEDSFEELSYTGSKVDSIIVYTDSGKTTKIREELYTYSGNKVSTVVTKQYDVSGVLIVGETMTETFTYTGSTVTSIDRVMS